MNYLKKKRENWIKTGLDHNKRLIKKRWRRIGPVSGLVLTEVQKCHLPSLPLTHGPGPLRSFPFLSLSAQSFSFFLFLSVLPPLGLPFPPGMLFSFSFFPLFSSYPSLPSHVGPTQHFLYSPISLSLSLSLNWSHALYVTSSPPFPLLLLPHLSSFMHPKNRKQGTGGSSSSPP